MERNATEEHLPPVTAAVINYNGAKVLENTLRSILESAYPSFEVILVDDRSTDGGVELVRQKFPQVRVFEQPRNMGLNAGRNRALLEARHGVVLLCDNDMTLEPGCLRLLVEAMTADPAAGITTPLILDSEIHDQIYSDSVELHYLAYGIIPLRHQKIPPDFDWSARRMVVGSGGMLLVRKPSIAPLGGFDEDYRFGYDEGEFALRATAMGIGVYYVPRARIYHIEAKGRSAEKLRFAIGNRWMMILTVYEARTLALLAPAFFVFELAQIAYLLMKKAPGEWFRGMSRVIKNLPGIMKKRKTFMAARKIHDRELMTSGEIFMFPYRVANPFISAAKKGMEAFFNGYWRLVRPFLKR